MQVVMIRHGATKGNTEGRYVGRTDEGITSEARLQLAARRNAYRSIIFFNEPAEKISFYCSPYKRCIETFDSLFSGYERKLVPELRECDFGEFEYKSYKELNGNKAYQRYIDSYGEEPFPNGESKRAFQDRCVKAFHDIACSELAKGTDKLIFVVHGGTIMSILDYYSSPHKDYFDWQVSNGDGIIAGYEPVNKGVDKLSPGIKNEFLLTDIKRLGE